MVPAARHESEIVIDRSRFLCTICRVTDADEAHDFVKSMQREYADATHNCWAWVAGPPASTSFIGMSDDGEPHGTAGRPMLTVLLHSGIGEIAAVVTRWYGGIKLGTGGLVKAYSGAVQHTLNTLDLVERVDSESRIIIVDYASVALVRQILSDVNANIVSEDFTDKVSYTVDIALDRYEEMQLRLADATRGKAAVLPLE